MFRALPILTVLVGVLTAGLISGLWSGRWAPAASLEEAAGRLAGVPLVVGDWTGADQEVNPREKAATQANGFLQRRYVNTRTGSPVSLLVLCGRPGPLSVHTPDICYPGSGFEEIGDKVRYEIPGGKGDWLWVRRFKKASATPVNLRVLYGWTAAGGWEAPDHERLAFARCPVLYKLYVIREMVQSDEPLEDDPAGDFLRAMVHPLRTALFPPA